MPNGITAASLVFGLASIITSASGDFDLAAWMILWGVLCDNLDGMSARLLNASSEIGVQLDSLADFCVFGIAPAALVYNRWAPASSAPSLLALCCSGYVLAAAYRLARFAVESPFGSRYFCGVSTTLVASMIASGYLTWTRYGDPTALPWPPVIALAVGALLMMSRLPVPKLRSTRHRWFNVFQWTNVVAAYIVTPLKMFPEYLFAVGVLYPAVGAGITMAWRSHRGDGTNSR